MMEKMIFGRYVPGEFIMHQNGSSFKITICFFFCFYRFFGK